MVLSEQLVMYGLFGIGGGEGVAHEVCRPDVSRLLVL